MNQRYRGLRPGHPGTEPIGDGEATVALRVRGSVAVLKAFEAASTRERGEILERAFEGGLFGSTAQGKVVRKQ